MKYTVPVRKKFYLLTKSQKSVQLLFPSWPKIQQGAGTCWKIRALALEVCEHTANVKGRVTLSMHLQLFLVEKKKSIFYRWLRLHKVYSPFEFSWRCATSTAEIFYCFTFWLFRWKKIEKLVGYKATWRMKSFVIVGGLYSSDDNKNGIQNIWSLQAFFPWLLWDFKNN